MRETMTPAEIAELRLMAAEGDVTLQYKLGCLFKLFPEQGKPREFHYWLAMAAGNGHVDACWELAEVYLLGTNAPVDLVEAHRWLTLGAERDQVYCLYNLGVQYATGDGVEKDLQLAYRYTRRGAELGEASSLYNMIMFHAKGLGVPQDLAAALPWAEKLVATGDERGLPLLMQIHHELGSDKVTVNLNSAQAAELTRQLVQQQMAEQMADRLHHAAAVTNAPPPPEPSPEEKLRARAAGGEVQAQLHLAKDLREADKLEESAQWLAKAAESGHPEAEFQLGNCYVRGMGVKRDYGTAWHWYNAAHGHGHKNAQQGLDWIAAQRSKAVRDAIPLMMQADSGDAEAQYQWAVKLHSDEWLRDPPQAIRYFEKAAEQQHAQAQFVLFTLYSKGEGVARNHDAARSWLLRAAALKHVEAVRFFMRRYADKEISPQTYPQAAALFADYRFLFPEYDDPYAPPPTIYQLQDAAFRGELPALFRLAIAYCEGQGIALDLERGLKMLQKAVERDYPAAQEEMARRYGVGDGIPKDRDKGRVLALKALKQGRAESRFMLVSLFQVPNEEIDRLF